MTHVTQKSTLPGVCSCLVNRCLWYFWWNIAILSLLSLGRVHAWIHPHGVTRTTTAVRIRSVRIRHHATTLLFANAHKPHVVIVGKIIIDEYQHAHPDSQVTNGTNTTVTIGGGGPQAAWGAAAALALLDDTVYTNETNLLPRQPVTLMSLVGDVDWTSVEDAALHACIGACIECVRLVRGPHLRTPRIALWHDVNQTIQWRPLHESFGLQGADGLWRLGPTTEQVIEECRENATRVVHVIGEMGLQAPGGGLDTQCLVDTRWESQYPWILRSIEPVVFPDTPEGTLSHTAAHAAVERIRNVLQPHLCSPDTLLQEALWNATTRHGKQDTLFAIRQGPRGSVVWESRSNIGNSTNGNVTTTDSDTIHNDNYDSTSDLIVTTTIPAADLIQALQTPTGAGNAYAGAWAAAYAYYQDNSNACNGLSPAVAAAMVASAIGAVVCEYDHLPTEWNGALWHRLRQAHASVVVKRNEQQ
jgi:hypothetical protein